MGCKFKAFKIIRYFPDFSVCINGSYVICVIVRKLVIKYIKKQCLYFSYSANPQSFSALQSTVGAAAGALLTTIRRGHLQRKSQLVHFLSMITNRLDLYKGEGTFI